MPTTFNGIGTHYYGKRNRTTRHGVCEHCHREVELSTYDTTLFFVLLFIPLIPMGKKRIIDHCPRCTRHHAVPLDQYQEMSEQTVAELAARERSRPDDVDAALAHNSALWELDRHDQAASHLETVLTRFAGSAEAQFYAASVFERAGDAERADRCFGRAWELDPNNPAIRRARAIDAINKRNPDEAYSLLSSLAAEDRDPGPFFLLALAYQDHDNHSRALEVLQQMQRDFPGVDEDKEFRRVVRVSEKQNYAPVTMLPRRMPPWLKKAAVVVAVVAVAVAGVGAWSAWASRHRTVHIVNGWPGPLTVTVDGDLSVEMDRPGHRTVDLAEGPHRADISGPWTETIEFEVESGFWERFDDDSVRVLNPGGLALVYWEKTFYSTSPDRDSENPVRFHGGTRFEVIRNIDYPFREFPESISISSSSSKVGKTRVGLLQGDPAELVSVFVETSKSRDGLKFLEAWLAAAPDAGLALTYGSLALMAGEGQRAEKLLGPGLSLDPVNVEWHRAYQAVCQRDGTRHRQLIAEYDGHLESRPDDSMLLYLRGRIETDPTAALRYYRRAGQQDRGNAYPPRAMGYQHLALGRFELAHQVLGQGLAGHPGNPDLAELYRNALLAQGRLSEVEGLLRPNVERDPKEIDWSLARELVLLLHRSGRHDDAAGIVTTLEQKGRGAADLAEWLRAYELYGRGKLGNLSQYLKTKPLAPSLLQAMEFWIALESGDVATASTMVRTSRNPAERGFHALLMSILYTRDDTHPHAEDMLDRALADLGPLDPAYRTFAALMRGETAITPDALDTVLLRPARRAVLLTALAQKYPEHRQQLLAEAERLNFGLGFPHRFLKEMGDKRLCDSWSAGP